MSKRVHGARARTRGVQAGVPRDQGSHIPMYYWSLGKSSISKIFKVIQSNP